MERPRWKVVAVDRCVEALEVASQNYADVGERFNLGDVQFKRSDWFSEIGNRFDLILANPPYVALDDPLYEGSGFEPARALFSGPSGLEALQTIVSDSPMYLRPAGWLLVEHGNLQGDKVRKLMDDAGLHRIESRQDLAGHERMTLGRAS